MFHSYYVYSDVLRQYYWRRLQAGGKSTPLRMHLTNTMLLNDTVGEGFTGQENPLSHTVYT